MPIELDDIRSGYNLSKINSNFQRIEDAWDEKLDRLVNDQGNQMEQQLDMNSNKIINHPPTDLEEPTDLVRVDALNQFGDFTGVVPAVASYTGDGVTVAFPKPVNANDARTFQVYVGGLRQEPYTDYQIVGETVVFTQAPVLDVSVDIYGYSPTVIENGAPVYADPILANFIGDGTTTNFFVSAQGSGTDSAFISIDGVNQVPFTDFTNAGGAISFTEAPPLNSEIFVRIFAPFTNNATDSFVTADGTTEARRLGDRFADVLHVKDFGVVGDGVVNDTVAFQAALDAILSGGTLDLGDLNIRVEDLQYGDASGSKILSGDVKLIGSGATVSFNNTSPLAYGIGIRTAGFNLTIERGITFDFNLGVHRGLYFDNNLTGMTPETLSNVYLDCNVFNCRRSSTAFIGGDAVYVRGAYNSVEFGGHIKNVLMATGAGVVGSQGVTGITTTDFDETSYIISAVIKSSARIEDVYSEDASYENDQDGIRAFGPIPSTEFEDNPATLVVESGAVIKGCGGRHIKTQLAHTQVSGTYIVDRNNGATGTLPIIGLQYGGTVDGATVIVNAPKDAVVSSGGYNGDLTKAPPTRFLNTTVTINSTLNECFSTFPRNGFSGNVTIDNINVYGDCNIFADMWVNSDHRKDTITNVNIEGTLNSCFVQAYASGSVSPYAMEVYIDAITYSGTQVEFAKHRQTGAVATMYGSVGVIDGFLPLGQWQVTDTEDVDNRPLGFKPRKMDATVINSGSGGAFGGETANIAVGATQVFSKRGRAASGPGIYFITASGGLNTNYQGIFATDGTAVIDMTPEVGAGITYKANPADPDGGNHLNIWIDNAQIHIKNTTSSARSVTLWSMS